MYPEKFDITNGTLEQGVLSVKRHLLVTTVISRKLTVKKFDIQQPYCLCEWVVAVSCSNLTMCYYVLCSWRVASHGPVAACPWASHCLQFLLVARALISVVHHPVLDQRMVPARQGGTYHLWAPLTNLVSSVFKYVLYVPRTLSVLLMITL